SMSSRRSCSSSDKPIPCARFGNSLRWLSRNSRIASARLSGSSRISRKCGSILVRLVRHCFVSNSGPDDCEGLTGGAACADSTAVVAGAASGPAGAACGATVACVPCFIAASSARASRSCTDNHRDVAANDSETAERMSTTRRMAAMLSTCGRLVREFPGTASDFQHLLLLLREDLQLCRRQDLRGAVALPALELGGFRHALCDVP